MLTIVSHPITKIASHDYCESTGGGLVKLYLAIVSSLLLAAPAFAVTANWTGVSETVTTVTYQQAWRCQYEYGGKKFWMTFKNSCPATVEVQ